MHFFLQILSFLALAFFIAEGTSKAIMLLTRGKYFGAAAGKSYSELLALQPFTNTGRQRAFITGIQGVSAGGQAQINLPTDRRFHRLIFQTTAIYLTGGNNLTATALTGSGTGLKVDVAVNGGYQVATIAPHAGAAGTGFVTGNTITYSDPTGVGFVGTVTAAAGAVTAIAITTNGTPSAIPANLFATTVKLIVNGVNIADLTAAQEILRAQFAPGCAGAFPVTNGQLPILFTEPQRNFTKWPEITSWDMAGQNAFQVQIAINSNLVTPGLTGQMEFDYIRNTVAGAIVARIYQQMLAQGNAPAPMLMPISRHAFTFQLNAGLNLIGQGQIPFNYPILRLLLLGSIPGNITQLEIDQDSNKALEGYIITQNNGGQLGQESEMLLEYGFNNSVVDAAYVADISGRIQDALKCQSNLQLKIYSAVSQSLTIIQEKLPKSYAS